MKRCILLTLLLAFSIGCAKNFCPTVPRPHYPGMKRIYVQNGAIKGESLKNVVENMLNLQQLVDELMLAPCYKENQK